MRLPRNVQLGDPEKSGVISVLYRVL